MNIVTIQPLRDTEYETVGLPDPYTYDTEQGYIEPLSDYVISRSDGIVLSRYGDLIWDLSPYAREFFSINFSAIIDSELQSEAKRLTYLYFSTGHGRDNTMVGGATLSVMFSNCIKPLTEFASLKGISLKAVLESPKYIKYYIANRNRKAPNSLATLRSLLGLLQNTSSSRSGIDYKPNQKNSTLLSRLIQLYFESVNQTELIPVSIYAAAAKSRWEHVKEIEKNIKGIVGFLKERLENNMFARPENLKLRKNYVSWEAAVTKYRLGSFFAKYSVYNLIDFQQLLTQIQITCRHLIHQYTGMRERECATLAWDCWLQPNETMPPRIQGYESKIHGAKTSQVWITHYEIKRAIDILNPISKVIYDQYTPYLKKRPLIIATGFLHGRKKRARYSYEGAVCGGMPSPSDPTQELPLELSGIILTQQHVDEELKAVEPLRDWSAHKFLEVGKPWFFSSHQYRRSLAVYALNSGLVSLFAIKEQFGHLLQAMSAYYGNGHLVAKKLDGQTNDDDHIANYMARMRHYVEAMAFTKNVSLSEERLYGGGGIHFEKHLIPRTVEAREQVLKNLNHTIKQFKKGLMRWRDTPMGGCISPDPCDKYLFPIFFISCKECEHSIQKLSKIEKLVETQRKSVLKLGEREPDTVAHRIEVSKLLEMEKYADWMRKKAEYSNTMEVIQ